MNTSRRKALAGAIVSTVTSLCGLGCGSNDGTASGESAVSAERSVDFPGPKENLQAFPTGLVSGGTPPLRTGGVPPSTGTIGTGGGTAFGANFAEAAALSATAPSETASTQPGEPDTGHPPLPSLPSTGSRNAAAATFAPSAATARFRFCNPIFGPPCPFDGIVENCTGCETGFPPDPNAAIGAGEIVQVVNSRMQVTNKVGTILCNGGVNLKHFLRTADSLTDPRILFDDVNQRFVFAITVSNPPASAAPAMWVAASNGSDACGTWNTYRLTFNGDPFPNGTFLDFPMLGQDRDNLLISTRNCLPNKPDCFAADGANFSVFGLPKNAIYAGNHVQFNTFAVQSLTAPVINAGQPMVASDVSHFLAAVPGTGYVLYRLTHGGGDGATITPTAIAAPFEKPSRNANQPGTSVTIDPTDGNIVAAPYFDGTSIWFAHVVNDAGFPTVKYGAVNTGSNTVVTALAFHAFTSDDFNPSLAVAITSLGETIHLNWAFTNTAAQVATSDVVRSFAVNALSPQLANLVGGGDVYASGAITNGQGSGNGAPARFGDFSSVSIDPANANCAVATQEYFGTDGNWRTRIAPIGDCASLVFKPL